MKVLTKALAKPFSQDSSTPSLPTPNNYLIFRRKEDESSLLDSSMIYRSPKALYGSWEYSSHRSAAILRRGRLIFESKSFKMQFNKLTIF
jgi:hypothetical protein